MTLIKLSGVTKKYYTKDIETHALSSVCFDIDVGDTIAIIGRSGCGKSTLLNIIGLIDRSFEGSYKLDGLEISGKSDTSLCNLRRSTFGYIFQNNN